MPWRDALIIAIATNSVGIMIFGQINQLLFRSQADMMNQSKFLIAATTVVSLPFVSSLLVKYFSRSTLAAVLTILTALPIYLLLAAIYEATSSFSYGATP